MLKRPVQGATAIVMVALIRFLVVEIERSRSSNEIFEVRLSSKNAGGIDEADFVGDPLGSEVKTQVDNSTVTSRRYLEEGTFKPTVFEMSKIPKYSCAVKYCCAEQEIENSESLA